MRPWSRLCANRGLWSLLAVLGAALVFVSAASGPANQQNEDRALREAVAAAPTATRDLAVFGPAATGPSDSAAAFRDRLSRLLPAELADVLGEGFGIQRTQIEGPDASGRRQYASLTGRDIGTDPGGYLPLATLHYQTNLVDQVTIREGAAPATDPAGEPVEVMVSASVAEALELRVGEVYHLLPGAAIVFPMEPSEAAGPVVALTVTGIFEPRNLGDLAWELDLRLLEPSVRQWPPGSDDPYPLRQATLVTDQAGIDVLRARGLEEFFGFQSVAGFRFDEALLDAAWASPAQEAMSRLLIDPRLGADLRVQTGLVGLIDEYQRQAAAARAVVAVVAAGLIATGLGLMFLAARLAVARRGAELALLRARGASVTGVTGRVLAEALVIMVPAAAAGWLLHLLLPLPRPAGPVLGVGVLPLLVAAAAVLLVPVTAAVAARRWRGRGAGADRAELVGHRSAPARLTVEAGVVLLAGLGVLLLYRRELDQAGIDPYLSAVPVLIALAAGLLALRIYPWPLRLLGTLAARGRSVVGFLGLARASRAAPATALPVLVLVLAVAVGGFAGAVYGSIAAARDAAAFHRVGADVRVMVADRAASEAGLPDGAIDAAAAVPGVEVVAPLSRRGYLRQAGTADQQIAVITVDTAAYQQVLIESEAAVRLPEEVVTAAPGAGPIPILSWSPIDGPELTVDFGVVEYPVTVVGDVADLPALYGGRAWVLVPRQALPEPPAVDELLIGGSEVAPTEIQEEIGALGAGPDTVTVSSFAQRRAELAAGGFNRGLTMVFIAGSVGAAVGGLLAVGLSLVVQATARGRTLSLLRTMGLSAQQARVLLLVELVPVIGLAVAVGAVAGIGMPRLLAPALGLTEFTGGASLPIGFDGRTVALLAGLLVAFTLGAGLIEAALNRRLGLGQILRVD